MKNFRFKKRVHFFVKAFGSGFAVYKGNERLTCALDKKVAEKKRVLYREYNNGGELVYNPQKKSARRLQEFYYQYNPNSKVKTFVVNGEVLNFVY